jgi:hypothetical protein
MGQTDDSLNIRKELLKKLSVSGSPKADAPKPCRERLMAAGKTAAEADALCSEHEYNTDQMKKADKNPLRSK